MLRLWIVGLTLFIFSGTDVIANAVAVQAKNWQQVLAQAKVYAEESDGDTEQLLEQLKATPEQKQKMENIRAQYQEQISQHQQLVRQAQQQLHQLLSSNASQSQIRRKYQELTRLQQDMSQLHFEIILELREVLTPEQRREFADILERRRQNRPRSNP